MSLISSRLILRLLDDQGQLLGWGYQETRVPGDGALWPDGPCVGIGEATGTAVRMVVHWPDVHMRVAADIQGFPIAQGKPFGFAWKGPVLRLDNPLEHEALAPVTVREAVIANVPIATLGLFGTS